MRNVGLIQVDGTLPNLALMKLSTYHKNKGDNVILMRGKVVCQRLIPFDKVYISCIFDENKEKALQLQKQFKNAEVGGIGVDNNKRLLDEVNKLKPDYQLFNCNYSLGFTTRGCIRKCSFCKVPNHEGGIIEVGDIYDFWDKKHKEIIIMDNNILALPEHFKKIAKQIKDNNLIVDFNQGLDHRLLTPELCEILLSLRHKQEIRFAFDHIGYKKTVLKAIKMLKKAGLKDWGSRWYVYIGKKDTFETVYERMKILRNNKQSVYVMRDKEIAKNPLWIAMSSWGNTMGAFKMGDIPELLKKSDRFNSYKPIFEKYLTNKDNQNKLTQFQSKKNK